MRPGLSFSALELDALRETGNLGAGRAASALSRLLDRTVRIAVPKASVIRLENLPDLVGGPETLAAAVYFGVTGPAPGRLLLFVDERSLDPLLAALTGRPGPLELPLSVELSSALRELGNILCGSYLTALSEWTELKLLLSVPSLAVDMAGAVLSAFASDAAESGGEALLLENRLLDSGPGMSLYMLYVPEPDSLDVLLAALAHATGVDPRRHA